RASHDLRTRPALGGGGPARASTLVGRPCGGDERSPAGLRAAAERRSRRPRDGVSPMMRRLLSVVPTLLGVTILVFAFLHAVPGAPRDVRRGGAGAPADVAGLRHSLGLDRPLGAQLAGFVARVAHGDLGDSIAFRAPVATVIAERFPATALLAATALV